MTDPSPPDPGVPSLVGFDVAAATLAAALERHVEQVRAHVGDGADPAPTAAELARALLDFSLAEQEVTGAAAVWPADPDHDDGADPIAGELLDDTDEVAGDEVSVVLRMDFTLSDAEALLAAGDRARAGQERSDEDDSGDPIADAVFAIAHRHGWDTLAADEVAGLEAAQLTAQVITPATDQEP